MKRLAYIGLGLVLLGLIVGWVLLNFELVDTEQPINPSRQAMADPWLALERSLTPNPGVARYQGSKFLDWPASSALVANAEMLALFYHQGNELVDWVARGGILIVQCKKNPDNEAALDLPLDLQGEQLFAGLNPAYVVSTKDAETFQGNAQLETRPRDHDRLPQHLLVDTTMEFPAAEASETTWLYQLNGKTHAVIRSYGQGWLFITGEAIALHNQGLKTSENQKLAVFLFGLITQHDQTIWLPSPNPVDIPKVNRLDGSAILLSVLLFGLVLMWLAAPRLGPVIADQVPERRSLRERFIAEGRFLWRHKGGPRMVGTPDQTTSMNKREFITSVTKLVKSNQTGAKKRHDY